MLRIGAEHFGKEKAHAGPCPVYASEDFGNYTLKVPGAFFFLSSGKLYLSTFPLEMKATLCCTNRILTLMTI